MKTAPDSPRSEDEKVQEPPETPQEAPAPPESAPKPEPKVEGAPAPKGKRAATREPKVPKEKKKKAEVPKPAEPAPPDGVKESLVRFVAVRARELYPETRRFAPGPVRLLARGRLDEHPEVLESYRKNRRRGEQEALLVARALAEELAGRAPEEAEA